VRRAAAGLLAALALAVAAAPAAAERVDGATYRRLLAAAPGDAAALARLRGITAVDGRPVDLRRVLAGSDVRVRERIAALRPGAPATAPGAAASRRSAAAILAGSDYRKEKAGALARALSWLADLLSLPAGANGVAGLIVIGGAVAALAALAALVVGSARRRSRTRGRGLPPDAAGALGVGSASAEELDRRAAAAEEAGRFEDAMRLRLAAALTRLDGRGVVRVRRDTTVGQVARTLRSEHFDAAAVGFAGVVYGRRPPTAADAAELREQLAATVQEAVGA
jgi:hypothetical protein